MKLFVKMLLATLLFSLSFCKKNRDTNPQPPVINNINFKKTISLINTDLKAELGMMMRIPRWKLDVYAAGDKNIQGILTKVNSLLLFNPVNLAWIEITFKDNYPLRIKTKAGIIVEFTNYNRSDFTCDEFATDSINNKIIKPTSRIRLSAIIFSNFNKTFSDLSLNTGRAEGVNGADKSDCQKAKDLANEIGFLTNVAGCFLGAAEIILSDGASVFADPFGAVSTYYDCAQAYDYLTKGDTYTCSEQYAADGLGISTGCVLGIESASFALNCGINLLGFATDLKSCAPCDDNPHSPARSTGDPHLTTMDGLYYNFQGYGEFIAVKSTTDNFEIQTRQVDVYNTNTVTLNTAIAVKTGSDVICAMVNPLRLYLNNNKLPSNFGTLTLTDGSTLFSKGTDIKISTSQGDIILIRWLSSAYLLDYMITLSNSRKGNIKGIFGNFDGNRTNDLMLSNGEAISANSLYPKFADSWRVTQANSLFLYDSGRSTLTYTDRNFPRALPILNAQQEAWAKGICSAAGIKDEPYYSECVFDVALTNDPALAKSSFWIQAYFDQTTDISFVGTDVNYFKGVRLEVSTDQADSSQLNLLNWKKGEVYKMKDGATNASQIDAVALIHCDMSLITPAALQNCAGGCGVGNINSIINDQQWNAFRKGNLDPKIFPNDDDPEKNKLNPAFIPVSSWDAIYSAANIDSIYLLEPLNPSVNSVTTYCNIAAADNNCALDNGIVFKNSVFRFITEDSKKGFFIVSGFGKIAGTDKYWITLDIKIEK